MSKAQLTSAMKKTLTLRQFVMTNRSCSEELWNSMQDNGTEFKFKRESALIYAGEYMIHEEDGKYYVHAWWYAPVAYDDLVTAEAELYKWYLEFN